MSRLSTEIGRTIIRADQQGKHPRYPYVTYKEINSNEESSHQDIKELSENQADPTSVDITIYEKSRATISFNFLDKNRVDRITTAATNALKWLKTIEGREFCRDQGIVCRIISPLIEDRTVYQQAFFENKIGFDVRFDYSGSSVETIEGIDEINIGVTRDGVQQPELEIPIP